MTCMHPSRSGPVPAHCSGQIRLGRGERETRGEHRGRGERLSSGSRFVFLVLFAFLPSAAPAAAQERIAGFDVGVRLSGVLSTRLFADAIGGSVIPDTTDAGIPSRFERDTVYVRMPVAPAFSVVVGKPMSADFGVELAAGYTFGQLEVSQSSATRDAGSVAIGQALIALRKPVRGFNTRVAAGALWFQGNDMTAVDDMRGLNPVFEAAATRRWLLAGLDVDAGVAAQAAQIASTALEARQSPPAWLYRIGLELGFGRSFGR